jgi:hypothetical protein
MSLSQQEPKKEESKESPAEREEEAKRMALINARRAHYRDKLEHKPVIIEQYKIGTTAENEVTPASNTPSLGSATSLPKMLDKGKSYEITYYEEYGAFGKRKKADKDALEAAEFRKKSNEELKAMTRWERFKYRQAFKDKYYGKKLPKKLIIHVDQKTGAITPGISIKVSALSEKGVLSKRQLYNTYSQIMRAYKTGMGVNTLVLDFPGAEKDPSAIKLINVKRMLKLAAREGVAITIGPILQRRLDMLDPNNPKDKRELEEINYLIKQTELSAQKDEKLKDAEAEAVNRVNTGGLEKDTKALKDAVAKLGEEKDPSKHKELLKEVEAAKEQVSKRIDSINKDKKEYSPSSEKMNQRINQGYANALTEAEKAVKEANTSLAAAKTKLSEDDKKECTKVEKGLEELAAKAGKAAKDADNELKDPATRVKYKLEDLETKSKALNKALADLDKANKLPSATPEEKAAKTKAVKEQLTVLKGAMDNMKEAVASINTETKKAGVPPIELTKCQNAVAAADNQVKEVDALLLEAQKDDELKADCTAVQTSKNALATSLDTTTKEIKDAINPPDPDQKEAERLKNMVDLVTQMEGDGKIAAIGDELKKLHEADGDWQQFFKKKLKLDDSMPKDNAPAEAKEKFVKDAESLQQEYARLQNRHQAWNDLADKAIGDAKRSMTEKMDKLAQHKKAENQSAKDVAEEMAKLNENIEKLKSAGPAPSKP